MEEVIVTPEDIEAERLEVEAENRRVLKQELIDQLTVTVNGVVYAGDDVSQNRMGNVLAVANWHFNKALGETYQQMADNPDLDDVSKAMFAGLATVTQAVYTGVYKDIKVDWKGADSKLHKVMVESVAEALEQTMRTVGSVIKQTEEGVPDG